MEYMKPDEIVDLFRKKLNDSALIESRIENKTAGLKKNIYNVIWLKISPENLQSAVKLLCDISLYPHLAFISGNDIGEHIELIYCFSIYYGDRSKEVSINLVIHLSKNAARIPTIINLISGAQTTEREIREMFGVTIEGLPDLPNIFLPQDFKKGVYPLRRDEKGAETMVKRKDEVRKVE